MINSQKFTVYVSGFDRCLYYNDSEEKLALAMVDCTNIVLYSLLGSKYIINGRHIIAYLLNE